MGMTDRELLELAAKAAGVPREVVGVKAGSYWIAESKTMHLQWNPLTDDGDALRLAVKLGMGVQSNGPAHWQSPNCTIVLFGEHSRLNQWHDGDAQASTRRAIVRAAAAMAKEG